MKNVGKRYIGIEQLSVITVLAAFILFPSLLMSQVNTEPVVLSQQEKQIAALFEKQAREYTQMRERLERELPALPKEATPEQINAHELALQKSVQKARAGAKHGEIFSPDAARVIRTIITNKYKGADLAELRKTVMTAETQGVPLKVNVPYPEEKELVEMPPPLLLVLPQLPKQLRYRFVGRNLLLVDRENHLIVDYMTNALP